MATAYKYIEEVNELYCWRPCDLSTTAQQEPILTENNMFKIMYRTTKGYENAANHFMGLDYSYPTKESAIKAYTFLKKDSPKCIFVILGDKGRHV